MYYNDYSLRQLLELALRVPEIGAVNFNILYYILKTIIQNQGLEDVKPVFSFDAPLTHQAAKTKAKLKETSLKHWHSAESLQTLDVSEKRSDEEGIDSKVQSETEKWQRIKLFKRLDAVEDEIGEIHIMLAQLVDKISNFERVAGLQEIKFRKEIAELGHAAAVVSKEKEKDADLEDKLEKLAVDVALLMSKADEKSDVKHDEYDEFRDKVDKYFDEYDKFLHRDVKFGDEYDDFEQEHDFEQDDDDFENEKGTSTDDKGKKFTEHDDKKVEATPSEEKDKEMEKPMPEKEEDIPIDETEEVEESVQPKKRNISAEEEKETRKFMLHRKGVSDIDVAAKLKDFADELNSIKLFLKTDQSRTVKKDLPKESEVRDAEIDKKKHEYKSDISKADLGKIELELMNVSAGLQKLKEKCSVVDKIFNSDINALKEKNLILERTVSKYETDVDLLKTSVDEMVHSYQGMKENMQYMEKEMNLLVELPGLLNRMELLEGYVYSGQEYEEGEETEERQRVRFALPSKDVQPTSDKLISKAKKMTKSVKVADVQLDEAIAFKPSVTKPEKGKARDIEEYLEDLEFDTNSKRKFQATVRNVALIQDMGKKKIMPKFKEGKIYERYEDEEDYLSEEPLYEGVKEPVIEEFDELGESFSGDEVSEKYPKAVVKSSTFTSPDILAEHSKQLKGQVIVYVKKRLQTFEIELQHIESDLITVKKKIDYLEKFTKELAEKLTFTEANFTQRAGDLAALKDMAENHQISIVTIMHHLDRKAEAYAVNQKVSKKELTVIEDRVLKLCVAASSEVTNLEDKMNDSLQKLTFELDRKLFIEEFEVRLETLLHKMKMLENKLKTAPVESPVWDFDGIRPIEIKKYVVCKDGRRIKEGKKIPTWRSSSTPDGIIPIYSHSENEVSPETALRIQKELELAANRESRRFVEGAYTKIKVGRR